MAASLILHSVKYQTVLYGRHAKLLWALLRDNEFQGVVQSDCRQAPHAMLPITEHWQCVAVLVACAEMCVATILRVA